MLFFLIAGVVIYLVAEPFAEALIEAGTNMGLDRRTLVAVASAHWPRRHPKFIITSIFAWRLLGAAGARRAGVVEGQPVDNLLVGTIPLVFNIASYVIGKPCRHAHARSRAARGFAVDVSAIGLRGWRCCLGCTCRCLRLGCCSGCLWCSSSSQGPTW